jgi:hypothetical protein
MPLPKKTTEALTKTIKLRRTDNRQLAHIATLGAFVLPFHGLPELEGDAPAWGETEHSSAAGLNVLSKAPARVTRDSEGKRQPLREPAPRVLGHLRTALDKDGVPIALVFVRGYARDALKAA